MNPALKAAPGKILVIGQRNTFFSSLQAIAPTHWQLIQAPTLMQARQTMKSASIDLIMLMIDPLQVTISTVTELRLRATVAHLPIVIIDEKADVARQAESLPWELMRISRCPSIPAIFLPPSMPVSCCLK